MFLIVHVFTFGVVIVIFVCLALHCIPFSYTCIKKVVYLLSLLICLLAGLWPIFTKFGGKVVRRPQKNPLDFAGNLDHILLGFGWGGVGFKVVVDVPRHTHQDCVKVRRRPCRSPQHSVCFSR